MKLGKRLEFAIPETWGVVVWVGVSAGLTAILSWALNQPELLKYSWIFNAALYFLVQLKKGK